MAEQHPFTDGLTRNTFVLFVGDAMDDTGVAHEQVAGCDVLADVSPKLDSAYCPACQWQCRISGAWFMDLWRAAHRRDPMQLLTDLTVAVDRYMQSDERPRPDSLWKAMGVAVEAAGEVVYPL